MLVLNHSFKMCGSAKALMSVTVFKKCGERQLAWWGFIAKP